MTDLVQQLADGLQQLGLALSAEQQQKLLDYQALIQKWNKVYNLTATTDPQEMQTRHILDALSVIAPLQRHLGKSGLRQARLLDVGSGAGLPGVVIAICCPNVSVVCVDAVGKKAAFIQQVAVTLCLTNLRGVHARVEALDEKDFDVITSRAFSSLADFVQGSQALLAAGGVWLAMKSQTVAQECDQLRVDVFHVEPVDVPRLNALRNLVWMRPCSA